ncbi:hypothetical protein [Chitinolyticbacter albus]|uniref:hypothetical protein n=1 Tax=Chitinolyticbacter albus TaxID=2961951 RepID=UPI00210A6F34|nr:hypothetical protein [Chitinolyticbacter albus]
MNMSSPSCLRPSAGLLAALALLPLIWLAPDTASAAPPATVASCEGIGEAYPILGKQCATQYAKINHAPANAGERLTTFRARVAVLEIFRKALLCNGMYGATRSAQDRFQSGENGHLAALANLRVNMNALADPVIPAAYTHTKLNEVSINKPQCK